MEHPNAFMNALLKQHDQLFADRRKRTTRITLACFDGSYEFQLLYAGMQEIEAKAGAGIGAVYGEVIRGIYHTGEDAIALPTEGNYRPIVLLEVIRQGLIGGNKSVVNGIDGEVSALRANALLERYLSPLEGGTLKEAWNMAAAIMHAAFEGIVIEDEKPAPAPKKHSSAKRAEPDAV
ncbi:MAG: hypothetical protein QM681_16775 [Novosphingobium sp.]